MKKIIAAALCAVMLLTSLVSCSKAPEFSEIEARLSELIEASYGVNEILFGKGPEVYPRVYENTFSAYRDEQTQKIYYYYVINDATLGEVYAYKATESLFFVSSDTKREGEEHVYVDSEGKYYYSTQYTPPEQEEGGTPTVGSYEDVEAGKTYYFYVHQDAELGTVYQYNQQTVKYLLKSAEAYGKDAPVYEADGFGYYAIEYVEPTYDLYYRESDPEGYSYIRLDSDFGTAQLIKEYAESVYSKGYLEGIYEMLFTGAVISDSASGTLGARYYEYEDPDGKVWLMSYDEYEPLVKEKRLYDMSTAKIVRPSREDFVNIEIESYLESSPDKRVKVTLSMVKQDGEWLLDSATY